MRKIVTLVMMLGLIGMASSCSEDNDNGQDIIIGYDDPIPDLRELDFQYNVFRYVSNWVITDIFDEDDCKFVSIAPGEHWFYEDDITHPERSQLTVRHAGTVVYIGNLVSWNNGTAIFSDQEGDEAVYVFEHYSKDRLKCTRTQYGYTQTYLIAK